MLYSKILTTAGVSKNVFNDNYGLAITNSDSAILSADRQSIPISDLTGLDFVNNDFTIEIRHRLDEFGGTHPHLFYGRTIDGVEVFFRLYYSATNVIRFQHFFDRNASGGARYTSLADTITVGQFNHIVISFEQGVVRTMYINGALAVTTTDDVLIDSDSGTTQTSSFLSAPLTSNTFNPKGYATTCRIFIGRAADATDVSNLYNGNSKYPQPVPVAMQTSLAREYLLNQEQGRIVNNTALGGNENLEQGYSNAQVQFSGGAWVDLTTL